MPEFTLPTGTKNRFAATPIRLAVGVVSTATNLAAGQPSRVMMTSVLLPLSTAPTVARDWPQPATE